MLSSVSLGAGLKTRPTPPNAAPPTPSSPKQEARHCVTPDPSAAVEALEASLEACLKSAAALGGAAPTGAAARLAAMGRGRPSSTLYIVRAGRVETSYDGGERLVGAGASFGELCVLGLSTVSLVDATCVVQSDFFFIHRDRFLNAFSNLPEVLAEMAAREDVYRRRPVRVPKASLGSS